MNEHRGIYFIANDSVIDLVIAFLNSLRTFNPDIPICLIPFNDRVDKLERLREKYGFYIFYDYDLFDVCDDISKEFHNGRVLGHYRKLAIWEGIFDEFIYIDIDTIIQANLSYTFKFLPFYDVLFSISSWPSMRQWVWKDTIYETKMMTKEQIDFAANTGFIASRKYSLNLHSVVVKTESALRLKSHMELSTAEQPFLNYVILTSGLKYNSIQLLRWVHGNKDAITERWAGEVGGKVFKDTGKIVFADLEPISLIHWAGQWQPNRFEKLLGRKTRFFMPYKDLWKFYRYDKKNTKIYRFRKDRIIKR